MPKTPEKDDDGRYLTAGLSERKFNATMNKVEKAQRAKRRNAKRTATPAILKSKDPADLIKLGKKADGRPFTFDDLEEFRKKAAKFKKDKGRSMAGITFAQVVASARQIDVKRANNTVNDGSGIQKADIISMSGNMAHVRVKASLKSVHQEHRVKIRLEDWDFEMAECEPTKKGYVKAVKKACKGRVSFDCDCGRHQYWYRYMATVGNYAVTPPKEFAFPKIRNPMLSGTACKHVLKSLAMLQSPMYHSRLAVEMEQQAKRIGFGDDRKRQTVFKKKDEDQIRKARGSKLDQERLAQEFQKYQKSQKGMSKALKKHEKEVTKLRRQLTKARAKKKAVERDMLKRELRSFIDAAKLFGGTHADAIKKFAAQRNLTVKDVKEIER